jgi:hypothetical protein
MDAALPSLERAHRRALARLCNEVERFERLSAGYPVACAALLDFLRARLFAMRSLADAIDEGAVKDLELAMVELLASIERTARDLDELHEEAAHLEALRFLDVHRTELESAVLDALHAGVPFDRIVVLAVDPRSSDVPCEFIGGEIGTLDRELAVEELAVLSERASRALSSAPGGATCHVVAIVCDRVLVCRYDVSFTRHLGVA